VHCTILKSVLFTVLKTKDETKLTFGARYFLGETWFLAWLSNCITRQALVPESCLKLKTPASLQWKKCLGFHIFCEWCHKWSSFRPFWQTSSGSRPKPLNGSISFKFLLETRLKPKSFETLDDLQGFQVQNLWPINNKISN